MEPVGAGTELIWSGFDSSMMVEESELMAQLLGGYPFSNEHDHDPALVMQSLFWSDHGIDSYCWPIENNCNNNNNNRQVEDSRCYYNTMEESHIIPNVGLKSEPILVFTATSNEEDEMTIGNIEETGVIDMAISQGKRKFQVCKPIVDIASPKKKARAPLQDGKSSKNAKCKKADKNSRVASPVEQSSSCYSSEDDSNTSQELNGEGGSTAGDRGYDGKTRAGRGSATDPQSLYARKRRERINERLKILQNLVPNGTKVDISTMLDEAVQYVKFLQLQIKLLSSDELWMYAPIAYNGMNIGFDLKISPPQG
ncbi:hypothetical protein HPP92_018160 [Vanilla planifolia]|uniref:BHLH domain-containing protein n=1 Tax=Vanilla planifolia TaxID=51239 RepID=A0A835UP46_VANPL|nr:hypothetical protein HPP92_018160 [Vanilla planifolia]